MQQLLIVLLVSHAAVAALTCIIPSSRIDLTAYIEALDRWPDFAPNISTPICGLPRSGEVPYVVPDRLIDFLEIVRFANATNSLGNLTRDEDTLFRYMDLVESGKGSIEPFLCTRTVERFLSRHTSDMPDDAAASLLLFLSHSVCDLITSALGPRQSDSIYDETEWPFSSSYAVQRLKGILHTAHVRDEMMANGTLPRHNLTDLYVNWNLSATPLPIRMIHTAIVNAITPTTETELQQQQQRREADPADDWDRRSLWAHITHTVPRAHRAYMSKRFPKIPPALTAVWKRTRDLGVYAYDAWPGVVDQAYAPPTSQRREANPTSGDEEDALTRVFSNVEPVCVQNCNNGNETYFDEYFFFRLENWLLSNCNFTGYHRGVDKTGLRWWAPNDWICKFRYKLRSVLMADLFKGTSLYIVPNSTHALLPMWFHQDEISYPNVTLGTREKAPLLRVPPVGACQSVGGVLAYYDAILPIRLLKLIITPVLKPILCRVYIPAFHVVFALFVDHPETCDVTIEAFGDFELICNVVLIIGVNLVSIVPLIFLLLWVKNCISRCRMAN